MGAVARLWVVQKLRETYNLWEEFGLKELEEPDDEGQSNSGGRTVIMIVTVWSDSDSAERQCTGSYIFDDSNDSGSNGATGCQAKQQC